MNISNLVSSSSGRFVPSGKSNIQGGKARKATIFLLIHGTCATVASALPHCCAPCGDRRQRQTQIRPFRVQKSILKIEEDAGKRVQT
ncbi:hypothetical protein ASPWEDRAFT_35731 [Aspergillus wentii DTO 134E9]|uniref:Uncharacterized protein n=1 Tax=Aspergillus wentii DTO 134E9 TaxID=1073089 RepID=A0A1L9RTA9_ASPWE|nr:uncharacterized protein ASPWEDRAFT_35731 [Aspergillus wentii DTO 134E9]OJJ38155.1 hypothetical protein ASPWEDRAFT_35731 [Aspergillus wentii DTO 134E9]